MTMIHVGNARYMQERDVIKLLDNDGREISREDLCARINAACKEAGTSYVRILVYECKDPAERNQPSSNLVQH